MKKIITALSLLCLTFASQLTAEICGKVDAGGTYVHIDLLNSGKTFKRIDMGGFKVDSTIIVWKGLCIKPSILYANGHGELFSGGLGIGHYTPISEKWKCAITPQFGCVYSQLDTNILIDPYPGYFPGFHTSYKFYSVSPYVGIDLSWCFAEGWRIIGSYQYSWSWYLHKN